MGRRLNKREKEERKQFKLLIKKIRKTKKYGNWKRKVLKRDVPSYPKIPKGVQVHHIIEISTLLREFEVTSVREAINCPDLWKPELGIVLKRGEHFILSKLTRYKYVTKGFSQLLKHWFDRTELDRLDANRRRR